MFSPTPKTAWMGPVGAAVVAVLLLAGLALAKSPVVHPVRQPSNLTVKNQFLEYSVISIDPAKWLVTAREVTSGNVLTFRLPPAVFHGQTFDADIGKAKRGRRFSVTPPRNAPLHKLIMEDSPPGQSPGYNPGIGLNGETAISEQLSWEILHVDPTKWVVTAKHRQSRQVAKFSVNPQMFTGFRFLADLRGIRKGQGFSLRAPNDASFNDCCTLLEHGKK